MADYGRATFDVRHRAVLGGNVSMPYGFRLNPFMLVTSGRPFNITLGQDLNGDSIFNDRPAFAAPGTGGKVTPFGTFNTGAPLPGQAIVPINYGTGPASFTFNLRVSKSIGFGPKLEGRFRRTRGGRADHPTAGTAGQAALVVEDWGLADSAVAAVPEAVRSAQLQQPAVTI